MRRRTLMLAAGFALAWGTPLHAQEDWVTRILTAARLPVSAAEARREGVANDEIRSVLDAMRREKLPAADAVMVLDSARVARREHGPVDNFGAFVQTQLASGKRGRELAAAIRAEHRRAGKGNAASGAGQGQGQGTGRGNAADAARGRGKGNAADTARGRGQGGRPGDRPTNPPADRGRGNSGKPTR